MLRAARYLSNTDFRAENPVRGRVILGEHLVHWVSLHCELTWRLIDSGRRVVLFLNEPEPPLTITLHLQRAPASALHVRLHLSIDDYALT